MNETPGRTRRSFLRVGLLAGASALTSARFIGRGVAAADSATDASIWLPHCEAILVLIQLSGGNDGLNTVVPFTDDTYFAFRPGLALPPSRVLKISDDLALNGALTGLRELYDLGELALILGVGYPRPSQAHFRAREIWRTACESEDHETRSWFARALDARRNLDWEDILRMARRIRPSARYPCSQLASGLELASRFISAGTPVRAFCLCQGGYDTHTHQMNSHQRLLKELDSAMSAFVADLKVQGNFSRVLIMIFSEFGRAVVENHHGGTEHGSAAPMLIAGGAIAGGVYGEQPSLTSLSAGELIHSVDFRSVYATVLEKWLHVESRGVLGREFPMLGFL